MDFNSVSVELQQIFSLVYGALMFWALVFMAVGAIATSIWAVVDDIRRRADN